MGPVPRLRGEGDFFAAFTHFPPFDSPHAGRTIKGDAVPPHDLRFAGSAGPYWCAMFTPGLPQILIVLVIVLLLFGNRLPAVARSLGRSLIEFKKGVKEVEDQSHAVSTEER
jgi:sec-independent protein translocase protein TatA